MATEESGFCRVVAVIGRLGCKFVFGGNATYYFSEKLKVRNA